MKKSERTNRPRRSGAVLSLVLRHSFVIGHSSLVIFFLLSGCAIGPNYKRPAIDSPPQFRTGSDTVSTNSLADLSWWDVYKDETLKELIRTALTNNYDLRIAVTRVEQARAIAIQARSQFFPQIGYEGEATRGKNSVLGSPFPSGQGAIGNSFLGAFNASWEVDLWGRIRRLNESARAQFLAAEEARRGIVLSLVGDVAQAYFELLELDDELEIAKRTTNSFGETLRVFSQRLEGGVVSKLETSRAEAALATAAATVPSLERRMVIKENQISVLLGRNPGPIPRQTTILQQTLPQKFPPVFPPNCSSGGPTFARSNNSRIQRTLRWVLPWAIFCRKLASPRFMAASAPISRPSPQTARTFGLWRPMLLVLSFKADVSTGITVNPKPPGKKRNSATNRPR